MNTESLKTYSAKPQDISKKWLVVDAEGQPLGRLSSNIARILRGKHKPEFTPHMDAGDNVIVINAGKVSLSGNKMQNKLYFRHSGYPGGTTFTPAEEMLKKDPTFLVRNAVKGMLPKNRLGRRILTNLRVFAGSEHNLMAQKPEKIEF